MKIRLNSQLEVDNEEQIFNLLKELLPDCDIDIIVRLKKQKIKKVRTKVVKPKKIRKLKTKVIKPKSLNNTYKKKPISKQMRLRYEKEPEPKIKIRKKGQNISDYRFEDIEDREDIQKIVDYYTGIRNSMMEY